MPQAKAITTASKSFIPNIKIYDYSVTESLGADVFIIEDNSGIFRAIFKGSSFCFQSALTIESLIIRAEFRLMSESERLLELEQDFISYYSLLGFKFPLNT